MKKIKQAPGFTLIEIILYVAIIGMVVSSFISFSISSTNARNKTYVIQEVQANLRVVKELISREIKQASAVVSPAQGSNSIALELNIPGTSDNIIYSLDNGVLFRQLGSDDPAAVTNEEAEISSLIFYNISDNNDKDSIRYELEMNFRNHDSSFFDHSESLSATVSLR